MALKKKSHVKCQALLSRRASFYLYPPCHQLTLLVTPDCAHPLLTLNSQHSAFRRRDRSCLIPSSSKLNWFFGEEGFWNSAICHVLRAWFTLIRTTICWPFFNRALLVFTLNRLKSDTNCCPRIRNANFFTIRFIPQSWEIRYVGDNRYSRSKHQGWRQPAVPTITHHVF